MSVAETDEGSLVPVLDQSGVRVSEFLTVFGLESRIDAHRICARRLQRESQLVEAHRIRDISPVGNFAFFGHERDFVRRVGHVRDLNGIADVLPARCCAQPDRVPILRLAFLAARDSRNEQCRRELNGVRLTAAGRDLPASFDQLVIEINLDPGVGRNAGLRLDHDQIFRGRKALLVPVGRKRRENRNAVRRCRLSRGRHFHFECRIAFCRNVRLREIVRARAKLKVRADGVGINGLIEPQRDNDRRIESAALAIPIRVAERDRRGDE